MTSEKTIARMFQTYEDKLLDLMGAEAYTEFAIETARAAFMMNIEDMEDGAFKTLKLENFKKITEDGE